MSLKTLLQTSRTFDLAKEKIESVEQGRVSFINRFPLENLLGMTLENYTRREDKDSFCYWLEFKNILFGIGGNNATKFGIYQGKDGKYHTGFSSNKKDLSEGEAYDKFSSVLDYILKALEYVKSNQVEKISQLQPQVISMVLQKVLSLYYPDKFLTIGSPEVIIECARDIKIDGCELVPENAILINYLCKQKLSSQDELRNWEYEKIGSLAWQIYEKDAKRNYYILGSKYGDNANEDVFPEMLRRSIVATGFARGLDLTEYYGLNHSEIIEYLKNQGEEPSSYKALKHFLNLEVGDRIAIKADGSPKGTKGFLSIVGIAEVCEKEGIVYEYDPNGLGHVINVKYLHAPVYKEFDFGGYGSTIHKLSKPDQIEAIFKDEYQILPLEEVGDSEKAFLNVLKKVGEKDAIDYFMVATSIIGGLGVKGGDERIVLSLRSESRLAFTIGQRYCLSYFVKREKPWGFILSQNKTIPGNVDSFPYEGQPTAYFYESDEFRILTPEINGIVDASANELSRTTKSGFIKNDNSSFRKAIFDEGYRKVVFTKAFGIKNEVKMRNNDNLNIILYGPPGTGKTFSTVGKAISIANPEFNIDQAREIVKAEFDRLIQAGQIVFTTFHQSMSYEDFIEGIKPVEPKEGDIYLKYEIQNGILKDICERIKNFEKLTASNVPLGKSISNFNQLYSAFIERLREIIAELDEDEIHIFESRRSKVKLLSIDANNNIVTTGEKASTTETVIKDKLERIYNRFNSPEEITNIVVQLREVGTDIGWTTNYFAVFKALKEFEASIKPKETKDIPVSKKQNYVLIIDEINRGNISNIFGELITLIEEDKRLGKDESLEAMLPYSKKKFGLPPNLYLIGTMNTADRSVEALDTALRRRFSFIEMRPDSKILSQDQYKCENIEIDNLLDIMNRRIEKLLGRDYCIGHSYFMNIKTRSNPLPELQQIFQNKILPLLQEYFYGDWGKISLVLGGGFISRQTETVKFLAKTDDEDYEEFEEKPIFRFTDSNAWTLQTFKGIYEN
jgi:hypothetical protein